MLQEAELHLDFKVRVQVWVQEQDEEQEYGIVMMTIWTMMTTEDYRLGSLHLRQCSSIFRKVGYLKHQVRIPSSLTHLGKVIKCSELIHIF